MNSKSLFCFTVLISFLFMGMLVIDSYGQQSVVTSVGKSGGMGDVVSIKGNNFGTDKTKLTVFFGGVKATILTATDQLLEVVTPNAATYDHVSVTRAQTTDPGLTGYADDQFLLSFGGGGPFDVNNLEAQQDFPAEKGLYDICACDFDGDNDLDLATANKESTNLSILFNSSTPGTVKFNTGDIKNIAIGSKSLQIKCGDLNGDGRPDIVASTGDVGSRLFILQNTGGGNFTQQAVIMPLVSVLQIKIADLDRDGKPDLLVSHGSSGVLWILKNQTISSTIVFGAPVTIGVGAALGSTDALEVADLNGDSFPEIITSTRIDPASPLFVLFNKSAPGTIAFDAAIKMDVSQGIVNIKVADVDGDGKYDIIISQLLGGVSVVLNQSTSSSLLFAAPQQVSTEATPYGIAIGDLDGDGKPDIVVASAVKDLSILNNTSTPGALSFIKSTKTTTTRTRHLVVGDMDGDGKPDIAFTTIDDQDFLAQKVSVFRNKTCMIPKITPVGPIKVCLNFKNDQGNTEVPLTSNISGGATYVWSVGSPPATGNVAKIPTTVASSGTYSIVVSPQAGGVVCPTASNGVTVDVSGGSSTNLSISPVAPICIGSGLSLTVPGAGTHTLNWRGPAGFSATGNPATRSNFQQQYAGRYVVDIVDNGGACLAQQTDIVVEAVDAQNFSVLSAGSSVLCAGDPKKVLQVSPTSATYSYQWFKDNVALPNPRVYDTLQVSSTGEYFVKVTSGCGTPFQANTIKVTVASVPVASFTTDPVGSACQGQNIKFTSTSTGISNDLTPTYSWTFASGKTSTEQSPSFKYDNAGGANPSLVVSYSGACPSAPSSVALTINPAPVVKITNTDHAGIFEFCDGESITLAVPGIFVSYAWSTGESTSSIVVTEAGNYTVEVKTASCTLNAEQVVTTSKPNVLISADPVEIEEGKSSQLTASGLVNYIWSPADALSDATIANPVASPVVTTVYSVTGKDDKGCTGLATLQLLVKGEPIVNKLLPANFFSPNKDGNNDAWKVDNIKDYPQCNIAIYDEKGIKVYEAKPYNEDWDGTMKGKRLPDGVYYFIIRCDGEESKPRSGSITLLR